MSVDITVHNVTSIRLEEYRDYGTWVHRKLVIGHGSSEIEVEISLYSNDKSVLRDIELRQLDTPMDTPESDVEPVEGDESPSSPKDLDDEIPF